MPSIENDPVVFTWNIVFTWNMSVRGWRSPLLLREDVNGIEFEVQPSDIEPEGYVFSFDDEEDEEESEDYASADDYDDDDGDEEEFEDYVMSDDDDDGVEEFDSEAAAARLKTVVIEPAEQLSTCSICLEELEVGREAVAIDCSHKFHKDCLLPWIASKKTCPNCRFQLR